MNYSDRIKKIREIFSMTQKDMARELGISQAYLCNIESGKSQVNADVIFKLASRFAIKTLWLAEGIGEMFVYPVKKTDAMIRENGTPHSLLYEISSQVENGRLRSFTVDSDNMEPLFHIGDLVLIDTTEIEPQDFSIYLFETDCQMFLKRFVDGSPKKLTNEKPSLKNNDMLVTSSIRCVGRAIWIIKQVL